MSSKISFIGIFGTRKQPPPPPPQKHVHFAEFTRRPEYYDLELGKWINVDLHPTVYRAQFPASVLVPSRKSDDCD